LLFYYKNPTIPSLQFILIVENLLIGYNIDVRWEKGYLLLMVLSEL